MLSAMLTQHVMMAANFATSRGRALGGAVAGPYAGLLDGLWKLCS